MKQQRTNDLSALATTKIKYWDYPAEVIVYKDTKIIALNSRLSELERLKELHWALQRLEEYDNEMR